MKHFILKVDIGVSRNLHSGVLDNMHAKHAQKFLRPRPLLSTTSTILRPPRPFRDVRYQESNSLSLGSGVQEAPRRAGEWLLMNQLAITKLDLAFLYLNNGLRQQLLIEVWISEQLLNVSLRLRGVLQHPEHPLDTPLVGTPCKTVSLMVDTRANQIKS